MLERLSERVGTTGSIQGEGIANLLGRPPFDPLTLVLRESGQNIWDARSRMRSEEHTSELQSLMRISYAVFCLKKKTTKNTTNCKNEIYKKHKQHTRTSNT